MREALKKVRPDRFDDLVALNALYRPGALDQIPTYARGKRNPESIVYPDERLRPILDSSMGVILYQEQAMRIAKEIAGFSGAKADDLRKAIGKKNRAAMAKLKPEFVAGARASGTSDAVIDFIWSTNEKSADYSFNRSHAACYGLIAYRTAWLKANHPAEYMAALISSVMSTKDRVPFFVARCEEMGIEILPPDVNLSDHEFTVVERRIRFGLDAVKGVGYQAVEGIIRAREEGGPFTSLWDFCERVDGRAVNKKAIEALIKCGALGSTGATRRGMLEVLEQAQGAGQKAQQDALIGQGSIFDLGDLSAPVNGHAAVRPPIPSVEFDQRELLAVEKEAIGLFISAHPLKAVREALSLAVDCPLSAVGERADKATVTIGGIVTQARKIRTRTGTDMMFATLDDLEAQVEIIVFGSALEKLEGSLAVDSIVIVRGRVDQKEEGRTSVVAQSVEAFRPDAEELARAQAVVLETAQAKPLHVRIGDACRFDAVIDDLKSVLGTFPGSSEVVIELSDERRVRLGSEFRVEPSPGLRAELEHLLGGPARLVA
jgi:DNA polymerase-3 subunit alpha